MYKQYLAKLEELKEKCRLKSVELSEMEDRTEKLKSLNGKLKNENYTSVVQKEDNYNKILDYSEQIARIDNYLKEKQMDGMEKMHSLLEKKNLMYKEIEVIEDKINNLMEYKKQYEGYEEKAREKSLKLKEIEHKLAKTTAQNNEEEVKLDNIAKELEKEKLSLEEQQESIKKQARSIDKQRKDVDLKIKRCKRYLEKVIKSKKTN